MCRHPVWLVLLVTSLLAGSAMGAPRDVMIRSIDTVGLIVELHNFGALTEDLSGYRFCSHDDNQVRVYSSSSGLNGVTLAAGASLFLHFANDAPAQADHINISAVGSFAGPLDNGPYGLSLYFPPVSFANGATMADHVQWSIGGADNTSADERSDEAETGGLWTDQSLWVASAVDTTLIELTPGAELAVLHGPDDYTASGPGGAGEVQTSLTVTRSGGNLTLDWGASCVGSDTAFGVYEGTLGDFTSHVGVACSVGPLPTATFPEPAGNTYYLIVPTDGISEGSYGTDSSGNARPAALAPCQAQAVLVCD